MLKRHIILIMALLAIQGSYAQNSSQSVVQHSDIGKSIFKPKNQRLTSNKNKIFIHWGYNFSSYANSDIQFVGEGYDFTLRDVVAADRPTKLSTVYIDPGRLSIPQFNFHFGYFIKDNYSISLGWDHMKYVVKTPQTVLFEGYANPEVSNPSVSSGIFGQTQDGEMIHLTDADFKFEHTDGYNFASIGVERYDDIWVSNHAKQTLNLETGLEAGLLVPRSDVRLFGLGANHYWNIAGYGAAAKAGIQYHFFKGLYVQGSYKVGWTDLNNIRTTGRRGVDKAYQKIWFFENYWVLGFRF